MRQVCEVPGEVRRTPCITWPSETGTTRPGSRQTALPASLLKIREGRCLRRHRPGGVVHEPASLTSGNSHHIDTHMTEPCDPVDILSDGGQGAGKLSLE